MDSSIISYAGKITCLKCRKKYRPDEIAFKCNCGGSLDVIYDYKKIREIVLMEDFIRENLRHWKYWMFYPVNNPKKPVSFEGGGTPLFLSEKILKVKKLSVL